MAERKIIDWEALEKQYRLGQKSLRCLGEEFGLSHTAIRKRASKEGWIQDKSREVRELTRAALVSRKVSNVTREDVNIAVQTNIEVITGHRQSVKDGKTIVDLLQSQLQEAVVNRDKIEDAIHEETKEDATTQRRNSMLKAVSIPAHAGTMRDLSMALKYLIPLERQAFGIDEDGRRPDPIDEISILVVSPEAKGE